MDTNTTLDALKAEIKTFCEERDWDQFHGAKDLAIGVATEAAELLEIFRFRSTEECDRLIQESTADRQKVADEMADVLFFIARMAQKYDFDLSEIFSAKLAKNRAKYPVEKARGSNKKYTEL